MSKRFVKIISCALLIIAMTFDTVFAAASLVSPSAESIVDAGNILISVRLEECSTIKLNIYEEKIAPKEGVELKDADSVDTSKFTEEDLKKISEETEDYKELLVSESGYTSDKSIEFYTKELKDVAPGLYRIEIETLDGNGKISETINSYIAVCEKKEKEVDQAVLVSTEKKGLLQSIKDLIKSIFKF